MKHQVLPSSRSVSRWPRRPCLLRSPELRAASLPAQEPPRAPPTRPSRGHLRAPARPRCPLGNWGSPGSLPPTPYSATSSPRSCLGSPGADVFPEPNPRAPASLQDSLSPLFQLRAKCRPRSPGKTGPPRRKGGGGHGVGANAPRTLSVPETHTPNKEPVPSCSAVDGRVASFYGSETEEVLLASGRLGRRAAADHWHPPRELQPFTWVPASAGLRGAAQGAVPRAGGAERTAAAALPCSSGPAGRLFIRGPGPGPCRSIGQSVPLRAAPRAAALCPRRAPRRRRGPRGGREPAPPVGSTFSSWSSSSGSYSLCSPPPRLSSLRGTPASLNRL